MIKNLIFDMGGIVFRQNTEEAFQRFRNAGITHVEDYMGTYGQKDFFLDIETGKIDVQTFCERMERVTNRKHISFEEAQFCWLGFFKDVPEERIDRLITLRKYFHVCLLSNTNPFIMDFVRSKRFSVSQRPISVCFDSQFCSYEMHAYKPNANIFTKALQTDNMLAEESVFLDDSLKNILTAKSLGFHTIPVNTNEDWWHLLVEKLQELNSLPIGIL